MRKSDIRHIDPCFFGKNVEVVNRLSFEKVFYGELGRDNDICSNY